MNPLHHQIEAALAGRYEIEREIGSGGMATVYLARDARHSRKVAVKVLNPELGAVLGAERFLSEIRVTANLQHPNLLPLFDSGEVNGLLFYVMPFIDGETLRDRVDREKQLPIDEAVRIATAIASALDYAHRHGVIHRDLKPENVLLQDGQPLIADFGIALAVSNAGGARVTQTGLSLGTPQYMSPEQATGDRGIDGRTDIYSLGALSYEMLVGEPPHTGSNAQAIIAKLMTEEPRPISVQRRSVPEHVEDAVHCALQKLPADRFPTAKDFADALNGRPSSHPTSAALARRTAAKRRVSPFVLAAVAVGGAAAGALAAVSLRPEREPVPRSIEFLLDATGPARYAPQGGQNVAFSPDGQAVAYVAFGQGIGGFVVRRLDSEQGQLLPGTEGATDMMYSPDSKRIAFYRDGRIFVSAMDGTAPSELLRIGVLWQGIAWANNRTIVYVTSDSLWAVDVATAAKRLVTVRDRAAGELNMATPIGMPDGETVAFIINKGGGVNGQNYLGFVSLDGSNRVAGSIPGRGVIAYLDGWLLYATPAGGGILAARFDVRSRKTSGEPVRLADTAQVSSVFGTAMSGKGDLVHIRGSRGRRLVILGPNGEEAAALPDLNSYAYPAWSPDGRRVVYQAPVAGNPNLVGLSVYDTKAGTNARLETGGNSSRAVWSPDGKRIAFILGNATTQQPYVVPADGSGPASPMPAPSDMVREVTFTPDGRSAVMTINRTDAPTKRDIVLQPLDGSKATPLVATAADENQPVVSYDGRWLAYMSKESGSTEVYVRPLNGATGSAMVSKGGGSAARWTRDGRIIYLDGAGAFRRVELATVGGLPAAGRRDSLFHPQTLRGGDLHQLWDYSTDGRFVVVRLAATSADVVVTTHWWQRQLPRLRGN